MAIENVSDTARWVAVYRAMESERPDALFHDPYARRLAGAKGEEIVRTIKQGRSMAWAMIVRTQLFDEIILESVKADRVDLVLNLAAGLDARPWRLALPSSLHWVDADLPGILRYKRDTLGDARPNCAYESVEADLTDPIARRALLASIGARSRRTLVVTEGLLLYLGEDAVGALAADLHAIPTIYRWVIDLASPRLLAMMARSFGRAAAAGNAPFRFAPASGTEFFRPFGWREARFYSTTDEARRLRREMKLMWLWRLLGRLSGPKRREEFHRLSGVVVLERI